MGISWDDARDRLHDIASLPANWDGNDSPGTDELILESVDMFLCWVYPDGPAPFVCPIPGGTLQLEWTVGDRHLEIEYFDLDTVGVLRHDMQTGKMETEEIRACRIDVLLKHLDWLRAAA